MFRLFESFKEYALLRKILGSSHGATKYVLALGQVSTILYWLSENMYILSKLKYIPVSENWALFWYCVFGLACYAEIMVFHSYNLWTQQASAEISILTMIKETIDNIGLLPYLGLIRNSWGVSFASSVGSCISAGIALYLKKAGMSDP